jgi:polar amino acid transport system substrate-binding protein
MKTQNQVNRRSILLGIASAVALLGVATVQAQSETLETIESRGKVIVGIQGDNPPFGFLDTQGNNDGYDADLARLLGERLGVPVEFVIVTNQNRIAALQAGRVDVLFATLGMNAERAQSLQYSQPYAEDTMPLIAKKGAGYEGFADLEGVVVGVPKGSSQETTMTANAPGATLRSFDDDSANIQALLSGQVEAIGGNQFYMKRINERSPDVFEEQFVMSSNYKGAGTRQGEKEWNAEINAFLDDLKADGTLQELYQKWFGLDLPAFDQPVEGVSYTVQ